MRTTVMSTRHIQASHAKDMTLDVLTSTDLAHPREGRLR